MLRVVWVVRMRTGVCMCSVYGYGCAGTAGGARMRSVRVQLVCVVRARKRAERAGCFVRLGVVRVQIVDKCRRTARTAVHVLVDQQEPEPKRES